MLHRIPARGRDTVRDVRRTTGSAQVRVGQLDVSETHSVRGCVRKFSGTRVHVRVHKAGALANQRFATAAGIELTFATHVAGPLLLTRLRQPAQAAAESARVIFASSAGM